MFDGNLIPIGTAPTQVYQCPATLSGAIHGMVLFNNTAADVTATISFLNNASGQTNSVQVNVRANDQWTLPKPIDIQAGDTLSVSAATAAALTALRSVYVATATPVTAGFNGRGEYSAIAAYQTNDAVNFGGGSYLAIQPNTGEAPTIGANNSYWMLLTEQGIQGIQGLQGIQGEKGDQGDQGVQGVQGVPGVVQSVNGYSQPAVTLTAADVGAPTVADLALKADASSLAPVAMSGSYSDLTGKPAIPAKTSDLTNDTLIAATSVGAANGVAPLGADQRVPAAYLPSYMDLVVEYASLAAFPTSGAAQTIYIALDTERVYRWGGSTYAEINPSPGSTDAVPEGATNKYFTAARAAAAAPVQSINGMIGTPTLTAADVGAAVVGNSSGQAPGVAAAGTANTAARSDHVHPLQTSVSGNAGTATKLAAPVAINGVNFDGSGPITVADSTRLAKVGDTATGKMHFTATDSASTALGNVTGAVSIDCSAAQAYSFTPTAAVTLSFTNPPAANTSQVILLKVTNGGAFTLSFPAGTKYPGGSLGTLTSSGVDWLGVAYDAGLSAWVVFVLGKAVA